jgi:hypothetical protein
MQPSNTRTNIVGIIALLLGIAGFWVPPKYQTQYTQSVAAIGASGLFVSKDNNK